MSGLAYVAANIEEQAGHLSDNPRPVGARQRKNVQVTSHVESLIDLVGVNGVDQPLVAMGCARAKSIAAVTAVTWAAIQVSGVVRALSG